MSTFLSASAVRAQTVASVGGAISLYAERHGVTAARVSTGAELGPTDVAVFSPVHGWVVVRWFSYAPHLPATLTLSSMLSTVAHTSAAKRRPTRLACSSITSAQVRLAMSGS